MIKIHQNYSLKLNNTFGVDIVSPLFCEPANLKQLELAVRYAEDRSLDRYIIGEGSNLLFTGPFDGLLIRPLFQGIELVDSSSSELLIRAGAGVNWDSFVAYCVQQQWYGTENLSLIPGSVGAVPVQNIGAYGVEAKDIIELVEVFDSSTMRPEVFSNTACKFGYRDSIFKHVKPGMYIVTAVVFRLARKAELVLDYGNVRDTFLQEPVQSLQTLRETIISIRQSKLPDPGKTGNAGSFFKNPVITQEQFQEISKKFGNVPGFPAEANKMKVPAAWLIEKAGWKGLRQGDTGTWPHQPLVIVNYGTATGKDILEFSEKIRKSVLEEFKIDLEREVTVIPTCGN